LFDTFVSTFYGSGVVLQDVTATDMREQFAEQYITSNAPVAGGAGTGTALPNNVAIALSKSCGLTGRSTRGRNFYLVQNSTNINNQEVTSTFATAVVALAQAIGTFVGTIDWAEVVASFVQNGVPLTTALTYVITSRAVVDVTLDSMRTRLPKRGD